MTPERYRLINSLADAALELPAQDRAAYLDRECAGDVELRNQVDRLVAATTSGSGYLETPLLEVLAKDMALPKTQHLTGRQIQHYTIVSLLGRGGIGEVWLARDARLNRQVALKLLSRRFAADPHQIRRLQQEARAASTLNHPNIVTIYEVGQHEEVDFIAEEFVPGETLRQRLNNGPLPLAAVLDIGSQVAAALAAAHAAGIVHRDIKPENIMSRPDGLVKVLDFGLARFLERQHAAASGSDISITRPGFVFGTARYMSPEQARGLPVGPSGDLFSLGVVLYEIVTGAPPFSGPTPSDVLAAILTQQPPPPADRRPEIPPDLGRIIGRCLEKAPAARYSSAADLQRDIDRLRWHMEAPGEPTPGSGQLAAALRARFSKSRKLLWIAAAAAAGLLVIFGLKFNRPAPAPSLNSMRVSRLSTHGEAADAALSADAKYAAYIVNEAGGQSLHVMQLATGSDVQSLPPESGDHDALAFSPDGNYVFYCRWVPGGLPTIYRIPLLGGAPVQVVTNTRGISVAPSGRRIAFFRADLAHRQTHLVVANADGSGEREIATRHLPEYFSRASLAWSPDETRIACFGGDSLSFSRDQFHLIEVTVATGAQRNIAGRAWRWTEAISWPPPGDLIYFDASEDFDDSFQVWAAFAKTGEFSRVTNDLNRYAHLSVAPGAKTMLALQSRVAADIWIVPASDTNRAVPITAGEIQNLNTLAWTRDGQIVYSAQGGDNYNIWIMDANGRNPRQLTRAGDSKTEVAATRDGKYILYQCEGKIWRLDAAGGNPLQLTFGSLDVHPNATADSRFAIYAAFPNWSPGLGGRPTLWKVPIEGGTPIELSTAQASLPRASPDGKWIGFMYFPFSTPAFPEAKLGIMAIAGGPPARIFEHLPSVDYDLAWAPDGKALDFGSIDQGVGNLWRQPLDGSAPYQMTHFNIGQTSALAWSQDGRQLAIARGNTSRDLVLMTDNSGR